MPEDFPKGCLAEALRIGDVDTIDLMFTESDAKEINLSLKKYRNSLRTTRGKIRFAELGWQQLGRVPDVALIRHYPSAHLEKALRLWCSLEGTTEDLYEDYKQRVLFINNRPVVIENSWHLSRSYVFAIGVLSYERLLFKSQTYALKHREPVGFEKDLGGVLALARSEKTPSLAEWKRGRTDVERKYEFYLIQELLFGSVHKETELECMVQIERKQLRILRGLLETEYPVERIKQEFYEQAYTAGSGTLGETLKTYPRWHFDLKVPHFTLFYRRLFENSNYNQVYTNEDEYRRNLIDYPRELIQVNVKTLRATWKNYPPPARTYLDSLLIKPKLGAPLVWEPYEDPTHQLCACLITLYFFAPSQIEQTENLARLLPPIPSSSFA